MIRFVFCLALLGLVCHFAGYEWMYTTLRWLYILVHMGLTAFVKACYWVREVSL